MYKQTVTHAYDALFSLKRKEIQLRVATWMNLENTMLSEIKSVKKRQALYDSTPGTVVELQLPGRE